MAPIANGDVVHVTYAFDYFGIGVLEGMVYQAFDLVNSMAYGPAQDFTFLEAPVYWNGVIAEWTFVLALDKLILDYGLWVGRLIFAIPGMEDPGDILGMLQSIKAESENRATQIMNNERFKVPPTLSAPTSTYYAAIRGMGRQFGGKTRGWRPNRYI